MAAPDTEAAEAEGWIRERHRAAGWSCSHDWGAAARLWGHAECMQVAPQGRLSNLNPQQPCMGFHTTWDVALPGQRWLPLHQRGPLALVPPTQRWLRGQSSSCQVQSSGLHFRPACPGVSGFLLIPGLAGVKNRGGARPGGRQAQGRVVKKPAQHMEQ